MGCPYCQGALRPGRKGGLCCSECGHQFALRGCIPLLLRHEDAARLAGFSGDYREARLRDGWRPLTPEQMLALPYGSPPGYLPLYWEVQRQSYARLRRLLADEGPTPEAGPAADLGAGIGWLGYRLAREGYRVLVVEASLDDAFGLGAAEPYFSAGADFSPVQGDLEHPPLRAGGLALVIFNASLHYARDLDAALMRAARSLRPGGRLIVLNTPIARQPRPGTIRGDRHLGRDELGTALTQAGLRPRWITVRRGPRWWVYQAKAWLKGDARFSFPMVVADWIDEKYREG